MAPARCAQHANLRQLNEEADGDECGGCLAEAVASLGAQHEEDTRYIVELWNALHSARERLNLLSPGAGDFLDPMLPKGWKGQTDVGSRTTDA